jgi:hypothetical protein
VILDIGLPDNCLPAIKRDEKSCAQRSPESSLMVVPDSPVFIGFFGRLSPRAPAPFTITKTPAAVLPLLRGHSMLTPRSRKADTVVSKSLFKGKFLIIVFPEDNADNMTALWAMDLSPGRIILPPTPEEAGLIRQDLIYS